MMNVRRGKKEDIPAVLALIKELAVYEKAPDEVITTEESMLRDGFGENPVFGFFVAEQDHELIGLALYYFRYSTWKGKCLYLEDLVVTESFRKKGIGKKLFDALVKEAKATNSYAIVWQVLDWNEPAIAFYKKLNANFDEGWLNCMMPQEVLQSYSFTEE